MRKSDIEPQPVAVGNNIFVRIKPRVHFITIQIEITKDKKT